MSKYFADGALDFVLVFEFLSGRSACRWSTKSINLECSGTCAPSNRFAVIRAEGVDQISLLVFFGKSLMFILADKWKVACQVSGCKEFILFMLACLLEYFGCNIEIGAIVVSPTFFFQGGVECGEVGAWAHVGYP